MPMLGTGNLQLPPPNEWQQFEDMCWRLWRRVWKDETAQKHGRSGQNQKGVDVYGRPTSRRWAGVQCRKKNYFGGGKLTATEIEDEVALALKIKPKLSEFVFATTTERDVHIQQLARDITERHAKKRLFSVTVYSWDDIRDLLQEHDDLVTFFYGGTSLPLSVEDYHFQIWRSPKAEGYSAARMPHYEMRIAKRLHRESTFGTAPPPQGAIPLENLIKIDEQGSRATGRLEAKNQSRETNASPIVLSPQRLHMLSLIAAAPWEFSSKDLSAFFPDRDWNVTTRYLLKHKLLSSERSRLKVPSRIKRRLFPKIEDRDPCLREWIDVLQPLKQHPDVAIYLSTQLLRLGKAKESVLTLVDSVESGVPGTWESLYLTVMSVMDREKVLRQLAVSERVRFLNSLGLLYNGQRQYSQAEAVYMRLRRYAKSKRNGWGVRQSYHNIGCVCYCIGDMTRAEECFKESIRLCRKCKPKDNLLLGRSLYELAMTICRDSPTEAEKLLDESTVVKRDAKDDYGVIGTYFGRATLAIATKDYEKANKWFKKSAQKANRLGDSHAEALALANQGSCFLDMEKPAEAIKLFQEATKTDRNESTDIRLHVLGGTAMARLYQKRYLLAEKAFQQRFELLVSIGDYEEAVVSLHDVGACQVRRQQWALSRKTLDKATKLARKHGVEEWIVRCQVDIGMSYFEEGRPGDAVKVINRRATAECNRGAVQTAANLLLSLLEMQMQLNAQPDIICKVAERCTSAFSTLDAKNRYQLLLKMHTQLHEWYWENAEFDEAVDQLEKIHSLAKEKRDREMQCRAQDQIGTCNQYLSNYDKAIHSHKLAVRMARRLDNLEVLATCLNNLGHAMRYAEDYRESVVYLDEAEKLARQLEDFNFAISIRHNRSLAVRQAGDSSTAKEILRECRNESRHRKLWGQYVHALHGLANLAWTTSKPKEALNLYSKAYAKGIEYGYDRIHDIALNYSNALQWNSKPKEALKVLKPFLSDVENLPNAYVFLLQAASIQEELGNSKDGKPLLKDALSSANKVKDKDAIATAAGSLGESLHDEGELEAACNHYKIAIRNEVDDELRLQLKGQLLEALIALKREDEISSEYHDFEKLSIRIAAYDKLVNAMMMIADYQWYESNQRQESLKTSYAAFFCAFQNCVDEVPDIGTAIAAFLSADEDSPSEEEISELELLIRSWIEKEQRIDLKKLELTWVLWPFHAARRIQECRSSRGELDEDEIAGILKSEVRQALRNGCQY